MASDGGRRTNPAVFLTTFFLCGLGWARTARAVQQHGGAEGLVSHQLGHLLFFAGMTFLLFRIVRSRSAGPGWPEFRGFLWLILLWNLLTFTGHWMQEFVGPEKYVRTDGRTVGYFLSSPFDALFYLTRLDHLVLVPSFLLLLAALRRWRKQS